MRLQTSLPRQWSRSPAPVALVACVLTLLSGNAPAPARPVDHQLPAIVFVSRNGAPQGEIPGLGPHGRTLSPGGRLMIRDSSGGVRELVGADRLFDASDPAVSWDARLVAFAGKASSDSAWRIYLVDLDGANLRALTHTEPPPDLSWAGAAARALEGADDFDPCWIGAHRLVFASTRWPLESEYGDSRATNLYALDVHGGAPRRLTTERNGAEEPAYDPATRRLVFSRWWFNRHRASNLDPSGITTDASRAVASDSVNLWQLVSFDPASHDTRLAAGSPNVRAACMGYQPAMLPDRRIAAVFARHLGLSPSAGAVGIEIFGSVGHGSHRGVPAPARDAGDAAVRAAPDAVPFTIAAPRRLAGPAGEASSADPYHEASGLAAPQACSPAALPDGRIVFAFDPGARGDFGLYVMRADGTGLTPLVDLPGTLELDPSPVVLHAWPESALDLDRAALGAAQPPHEIPPAPPEGAPSFRFHCLNLFANAPMGSPIPRAPLPASDLSVRFFAALSRPAAAGGDTVVLLRTARVSPGGEIDVSGLPVDLPMFEQVVDARGQMLTSESGPAHVAGFNASAPGERRCLGCHVGHSAIPVPAAAAAH
ncbi:MAG: hypothetical protein ACRENS_03390 [Candidatus Eiseniibacteriota bacterium]